MDKENKVVEKSMYYSKGSNSRNSDLILPRSKYDTRALVNLRLNIDPRRWSDIDTSYGLLYWCADWCWPTAAYTHELFLAHPQNAVAPIRKALQMCENLADGGEDDFVCSVMHGIVEELPIKYIRELKPDLESFVKVRLDIEELVDDYSLREVFDNCLGMIERDDEATAAAAAAAAVTNNDAVVAVNVDSVVADASNNASMINDGQQRQQTASRSDRLGVNETRAAGPSSRSASAGSSSSSGRRRR